MAVRTEICRILGIQTPPDLAFMMLRQGCGTTCELRLRPAGDSAPGRPGAANDGNPRRFTVTVGARPGDFGPRRCGPSRSGGRHQIALTDGVRQHGVAEVRFIVLTAPQSVELALLLIVGHHEARALREVRMSVAKPDEGL